MKDNSVYSKESERKERDKDRAPLGLFQPFMMRTCAFYFKEPSTGLEQFMYAATNAARLKIAACAFIASTPTRPTHTVIIDFNHCNL